MMLLLIALRLPLSSIYIYIFPLSGSPSAHPAKVYRVYLLKPIDGIQSRDASGKFGFIDNPHLF
jgi:hypothetical protein